MARKPIVDKEKIFNLLKKGETTQKIAEQFSVSRQAIDLHRKEFINKGLLPDKRAARKRREPPLFINSVKQNKFESHHEKKPIIIRSETNPFESAVSLDAHIDLMINAFDALKRLPVVEKELDILKWENERIKQEIDRLKNRQKKRLEQEDRWMLIKPEDMPDPPS